MGEEGVVFSSAGVKVLSIYGVSEQSCPALQRLHTHTRLLDICCRYAAGREDGAVNHIYCATITHNPDNFGGLVAAAVCSVLSHPGDSITAPSLAITISKGSHILSTISGQCFITIQHNRGS